VYCWCRNHGSCSCGSNRCFIELCILGSFGADGSQHLFWWGRGTWRFLQIIFVATCFVLWTLITPLCITVYYAIAIYCIIHSHLVVVCIKKGARKWQRCGEEQYGFSKVLNAFWWRTTQQWRKDFSAWGKRDVVGGGSGRGLREANICFSFWRDIQCKWWAADWEQVASPYCVTKCGLLDLLKLQTVVCVLGFKYFRKALSLTLQVFFLKLIWGNAVLQKTRSIKSVTKITQMSFALWKTCSAVKKKNSIRAFNYLFIYGINGIILRILGWNMKVKLHAWEPVLGDSAVG